MIVAALVLVSLVRAGVSDGPPRTASERTRDIASTIKCPTCRSQSVADSDAAAARTIRNDIARRVSDGESPDEIRAAVAANYGDDVLLTPPQGGLGGIVWALPVVALVAALAALSAAFARWRGGAAPEPDEADRALVERALAERALAERER